MTRSMTSDLSVGAEGFDEGGGFRVVFVDLDAAEDLEAGLVGVVHEEEGYAGSRARSCRG